MIDAIETIYGHGLKKSKNSSFNILELSSILSTFTPPPSHTCEFLWTPLFMVDQRCLCMHFCFYMREHFYNRALSSHRKSLTSSNLPHQTTAASMAQHQKVFWTSLSGLPSDITLSSLSAPPSNYFSTMANLFLD